MCAFTKCKHSQQGLIKQKSLYNDIYRYICQNKYGKFILNVKENIHVYVYTYTKR